MQSFVQSFVQSLRTQSFVQSFVQSFAQSFVQSLRRASRRASVHRVSCRASRRASVRKASCRASCRRIANLRLAMVVRARASVRGAVGWCCPETPRPHSQYATYYFSVITVRKGTSYSPGRVQAISPKCCPQAGGYTQQQNGLQAKESSSSSWQRTRSNRRIQEATPHSRPLGTGHHRQAKGGAQANHQTLPLPPRPSKIHWKYSMKGRQNTKAYRLGEGGARKTSWQDKPRFFP